MEGMAVFGMMGFCLAIAALSKVNRLEQVLRENNIRPAGAGDLGKQLRDKAGQTVTIHLSDDTVTPCKVLEADEEWLRVIRNEGKKSQRELLVRLSDVKQIKG